jgi:hypothetical protein
MAGEAGGTKRGAPEKQQRVRPENLRGGCSLPQAQLGRQPAMEFGHVEEGHEGEVR